VNCLLLVVIDYVVKVGFALSDMTSVERNI